MEIKKINEYFDPKTGHIKDEAKYFVCEYIKNGSEMSMLEYFNFIFQDNTKIELIKDIKALCVNLYLDSKNEL